MGFASFAYAAKQLHDADMREAQPATAAACGHDPAEQNIDKF
jgi:hypothetical protein